MANENEAIHSRAKELLAGETGVTNEYPHVFQRLEAEFPNVSRHRIYGRMNKVLRQNRY